MTLTDLERLMEGATKGEWRAGRMDMESYDANGEGPYKNIYVDDPRGKIHLGEHLPYTVARGEGDECRANAALIVALRNMAPALVKVARIAGERPTRFGPHYAMWLDKMDDALREMKEGKDEFN